MKGVVSYLAHYGILLCLGIVLSIGTTSGLVQASTQSVATPPAHAAESLVEQGRILYERGNWQDAFASWQQATQLYRELDDTTGITGSLLNQTKALTMGGHYRQACSTALEAIGLADRRCDFSQPTTMAIAMSTIETETDADMRLLKLATFGNVLGLNGYLVQAQTSLAAAVATAQALERPVAQTKTWLSLGNVQQLSYQQTLQLYQQTQDPDERTRAMDVALVALASYQQAANLATTPLLQAQTAAQLLELLTHLQQQSAPLPEHLAKDLSSQIQTQLERVQRLPLENLSASRALTDTQLSLAQSLIRLWVPITAPPAAVWPLLEQAQANAIALQDIAAQSQTLGVLGHLYEVWNTADPTSDHWQQAQQSTQKALSLAQSIQAAHLAYQWSWQLGRLYKQGEHQNVERAISYYQTAVDTLTTVRQDLLGLNPDVRFALRDNSEPLYREFILLLLESPEGTLPSQDYLRQAIREVDALQLAQLEDFLSCNLTQQVTLDEAQTDPTTAVVYPIILPEQLAVVVKFPNSETLQFYRTQRTDTDIPQLLDALRREVERPFLTQTFFNQAQQVYDWLIRPIETQLSAHAINTLVFVSDGALRNIPMAILHDGQQFLIEKYAIALSPGLTLPSSQPLSKANLQALAFGLSETRPDFAPHQGFSPLENVETELTIIQTQLPSQKWLNQDFTSSSLQDLVHDQSSPVVHLATHGQFSSNPDETFLLAWDRRLTLNDLSQLLSSRTDQTAIELLVLSACQTATGDSRATLGLAGIAIQSGARSTVASLWTVDDIATTELMGYFYQALSTPSGDSPTRAQALRQAQLALLNNPNFRAPIYWSAFVLVGNWQ